MEPAFSRTSYQLSYNALPYLVLQEIQVYGLAEANCEAVIPNDKFYVEHVGSNHHPFEAWLMNSQSLAASLNTASLCRPQREWVKTFCFSWSSPVTGIAPLRRLVLCIPWIFIQLISLFLPLTAHKSIHHHWTWLLLHCVCTWIQSKTMQEEQSWQDHALLPQSCNYCGLNQETEGSCYKHS